VDCEVWSRLKLECGTYIVQIKVAWNYWNEEAFTFSSYGVDEVSVKSI
jgi:hypothetical protein